MEAVQIQAVAELITAISWPLLVLFVLITNRRTVSRILQNLESLTLPGGIEAKFKHTVEKEVESLLRDNEEADNCRTITAHQIEAAERVAIKASRHDLKMIHDQIIAAAGEYDRIRASMPSSFERTRQMEKVATKMRTLGFVASSFVDELSSSTSPGKRLAAIASLQVRPNPTKTEWLADRLGIEKPFVGYHAAVALLTAARVHDETQTETLRNAIIKAKKLLGDQQRGTDREQALDAALMELDE